MVARAGPDGYLLVDHPEPAANPAIQKVLGSLGRRPVKFLLNTHWHYDHVGGNEIYGPEAIIVAHENLRMRRITKQTPYCRRSPSVRFTSRAKILRWIITRTLIPHTDSDSGVYLARANVVAVGDIFLGKASKVSKADIEGLVRSLSAVLDRINDDTVIITGHSEMSNRRDLAQFVGIRYGTIALVGQEIAAGKSEKEVVDAEWKPWFAPQVVPPEHDFIQRIYATLTHTNNLNP